MAFPCCCSMLLFLLCSLVSLSSSLAKAGAKPTQIVLPIYKDASTLQYLTQIRQRTPLVPASKRCERCSWTPYGPGCTNADTCWRFTDNTVTRHAYSGQVASDVISINSTDGKGLGKVVTVPQFVFFCARTGNADGLAKGVTGMAGLGRTKVALPVQLATAFNLKRKFGLCLSSSETTNGVVIFGDGPYNFDDSNLLQYTSLIINKENNQLQILIGEYSPEYFIGVKSIKINNKIVNLNTTLLKINSEGFGGTKISTVNPYTVLETSIYNAVIKAFVNELKNVTRVPPVAPFGACFSWKNIGSTRVGPDVPNIDLVLEEKDVVWRMYGANSMVRVNKDVLCLGFVDGGEPPFVTSIVIGGHQLEDNLLTFDLVKLKLGFSSSLLFRQKTCSNYKLMPNA
ncbi:Basic 7S globulin [Heracleum sosnowskyi]|uniref:Basic 7S globulin n=1 Tax=Heracleum sosnowskyi TaxID=360622 RepID=A0AAD8J019_9APIA|nr:Basic 7S globulin [Heracleum sosnowskyi]